jgi:hypothetical protein
MSTDMLSSFPSNLKLSYENVSHKKVYNSDMLFAVPEGDKMFAWFTIVDNEEVCLLVDEKKETCNKVDCCFDKELARNQTIIYGTTFRYSNMTFFSCEDILYYKGSDISRTNWLGKLELFGSIFKNDIKQVAYNKRFLVFGMPLMNKDFNSLISQIYKVNYKITSIQYKCFNSIGNYSTTQFFYKTQPTSNGSRTGNRERNQPPSYNRLSDTGVDISNDNHVVKPSPPVIKPTPVEYKPKEVIFKVKADVQTDVYHLYGANDELYDTCCIPTYTTSVMMNNIFRKIKENINLDSLEESDDEDEFEDDKIDKYVDLTKTCNIVCTFNTKFKKWMPLRISHDNRGVVDTKTLKQKPSTFSFDSFKVFS